MYLWVSTFIDLYCIIIYIYICICIYIYIYRERERDIKDTNSPFP